jgi:hypothetical protein
VPQFTQINVLCTDDKLVFGNTNYVSTIDYSPHAQNSLMYVRNRLVCLILWMDNQWAFINQNFSINEQEKKN